MTHRRTRSQDRIASAAEEAALRAATHEQAKAEEEIRGRLPREVLNLHRRLENQQASVDAIQGNISKLTEMVAQISTAVQPQQQSSTSPMASGITHSQPQATNTPPPNQTFPTPTPNPPACSHLPYPQILAPPLETTAQTATQSPASISSEYYGAVSLRSSLCGRPTQQQHKKGGCETEEDDGATPRYDCTFSDNAVHFAMLRFRCPGGDLTMGANTSGKSIIDEQLIHKQSGPAIKSMANNDSNLSCVMHKAQIESSFYSLHAPARVAPQLFGEMPTPNSGYENFFGHSNQSPAVHGGGTNSREQNLDEMPQQYDFHNLNRKSVFLADGTQHSYFVLPESYSLERATSSMSPAMSKLEVSDNYQSFTHPMNDLVLEKQTHPSQETQSIVDMLAQVKSKVEAVSEKLEYEIVGHSCEKILDCTEQKAASEPLLAREVINEFNEMPVYAYEEDTNACLNGVVEFLDTAPQHKQYNSEKLVYDHEEPHGDAKLSCRDHDAEQLAVCFNNASYNAFSEEATGFSFPHCPVTHADRFIKLTNEKSTQAASVPCVQEATMHCDDERSGININKQYVLINKNGITYPCDLNNDKEVPITLQYQLPLSSAPCIWDPGIDLFSYKTLHLFSWIAHSAIIILQQEHFFFLEKGRQVQWDPGIQVMNDGITSNSTWTIRDAEWLKITEDCFAEQELMANTSSKMTAFTWHTSITETSFILLRNTTYTWDPGVLKIKDTMLDKCAMPHQVQFVKHTIELSLLISEAFVQYYAPNGVNSVLHGTSFMLQRDTHSSQENYFCSLHHKTEYCQMKCLWEFPISSAIRVQWGLGVKMSLYGWMDIFILRSETDKPLSCTHIPDLTAWQHQSGGISASYVWEPDAILSYTSIWLVSFTGSDNLYAYCLAVRHSNGRSSHYTENIMCYFTASSVLEEKEMLTRLSPGSWSFIFQPMQYGAYFQKCNALSLQQYSHQGIHLYGIALWLINFYPP